LGGLAWFELDVGVAVVVDPDERTVDRADPILDLVALLVQHRLEHRDFADGVLIERVLEFGFEAWQVVVDESVVQCAEPVEGIDRSVELERFLMPGIPEPRHRRLDAIGHGRPVLEQLALLGDKFAAEQRTQVIPLTGVAVFVHVQTVAEPGEGCSRRLRVEFAQGSIAALELVEVPAQLIARDGPVAD
jgi:hypothetical protein